MFVRWMEIAMERGFNTSPWILEHQSDRSWSSTSPHSTFLNRRIIFCTSLPPDQTMQLSSVRQFWLLGCTFEIVIPSGMPSKCIFKALRKGPMSISASPILSSKLNVSLSYTHCIPSTKIIQIRTKRISLSCPQYY